MASLFTIVSALGCSCAIYFPQGSGLILNKTVIDPIGSCSFVRQYKIQKLVFIFFFCLFPLSCDINHLLQETYSSVCTCVGQTLYKRAHVSEKRVAVVVLKKKGGGGGEMRC